MECHRLKLSPIHFAFLSSYCPATPSLLEALESGPSLLRTFSLATARARLVRILHCRSGAEWLEVCPADRDSQSVAVADTYGRTHNQTEEPRSVTRRPLFDVEYLWFARGIQIGFQEEAFDFFCI